jgi:predicted lipid-binding transport protein (Tim44 family)
MDILIYAIIAVFLAWRLYTVLGQRHEDGRERSNPFARMPGADNAGKTAGNSNEKDHLVALPLPRDVPAITDANASPFAHEPAPESLAGGLYAMRRADPSFDERSFLKGARVAFEMIVHGFTLGERGTLKNLTSTDIYNSFDQAITEREAKGERWEMPILTLRDADITNARMVGSVAFLTTQFISDQGKKVYDKDGNLVGDDTNKVERLTDLWVWRRDTKSPNPNWQLVETKPV